MGTEVKLFSGESFPLEMHKVRIVQKLILPDVDERLMAIRSAGFNTFLLKNSAIFLDMLTDSGVNAMSDRQLAAMMFADDSYAGSATFERLCEVVQRIFGKEFILPVHQGRAAENILSHAFVKDGNVVPMNYHFTTTKAHIMAHGGAVIECFTKEALKIDSTYPFKGNMDIVALRKVLEEEQGNVPFVRMEAGTNLIGGQPWSMENLQQVSDICREFSVPLVIDASLWADNLYFIKVREEAWARESLAEISRRMADLSDILYFSARKLGCAKGGLIIMNSKSHFDRMAELVPLFEGFLTYGGMSTREMEALAVGLEETMDFDMVRHGPEFIGFMVEELQKRNIPVVTPPGGLGCHIDATRFLEHVPQERYISGSLAAALFIAGGIRGMERGTLSETRNPDGTDKLADMELLRLAVPRRVFTLSQLKYAVDRIHWLFENRKLVGGLQWSFEPKILRFFTGKLEPVGDWPERLAAKFAKDFPGSL